MNLQDTIISAASRLEVVLGGSAENFQTLVDQLIVDLGLAFGEPGYDEALLAARNILALEAGITAVEVGDAADAELRGVIFGFLSAAAGR